MFKHACKSVRSVSSVLVSFAWSSFAGKGWHCISSLSAWISSTLESVSISVLNFPPRTTSYHSVHALTSKLKLPIIPCISARRRNFPPNRRHKPAHHHAHTPFLSPCHVPHHPSIHCPSSRATRRETEGTTRAHTALPKHRYAARAEEELEEPGCAAGAGGRGSVLV